MKYIKPMAGCKIKKVIDSFELDHEIDKIELDCPQCGEPARATGGGVNYGSEGHASWHFDDGRFDCAECGYTGILDPVIQSVKDHAELGRIIKVR